MSNEQLTSKTRVDLAAALERDLRQLGLDDGAAFIRAQQAEIERLLIHWLCQCGTANPITEQACASCGAGKPPDEPVAQLSNERCEHSPLYTYDSVGIQYRAPCPWCLQLELTRIVAEGATDEPPAPASKAKLASFWTRLTALAGDMEAELNRSADEPVAPSSPPADPDPEPSRADKLRAALKPSGVKVTVLGEADEPPAARDYSVMDVEDEYREQQIANRDEAIERLEQQKENLLNALEAKQARIDALMLEYCPGEMSASQRAAWSASQELASVPPAASQVEEVLCAGVVVSSPHDRRITLRFETDEQFRAAEALIGIADISNGRSLPEVWATSIG